MISKSNVLVGLAEDVLAQTKKLSQFLQHSSISSPEQLSAGSQSGLWTEDSLEISSLRSEITALTYHLNNLLRGPHEILHEYISVNWEHAALYTLLEWNVFNHLPINGSTVFVTELADKTGLPEEKLLRLCRLMATVGVINEPQEGVFSHTAISEELVTDDGFRNFIGFQLFETRVASAHLSDSLRKSPDFWNENSAFKHAWGEQMYHWHAKYPEKGQRFARAMQSVANGLDPGDGMIISALSEISKSTFELQPLVVEVCAMQSSFSKKVAQVLPELSFNVQDASSFLRSQGSSQLPENLSKYVKLQNGDLSKGGEVDGVTDQSSKDGQRGPIIFVLRSALSLLDDSEIVRILRAFVPVMQNKLVVVLICDLVSPKFGTFPPHVEKIYRRRDVTLMTMHNAKQRTAQEWTSLFSAGNPSFKFNYSQQASSHSCRGLWQITLGQQIETLLQETAQVTNATCRGQIEAWPLKFQAESKSHSGSKIKENAMDTYGLIMSRRRGRCSSSFADEF